MAHRIAIVHTPDNLEAWDFCRGVASYRPRSGSWGLHSIAMKFNASPAYLRKLATTDCDGIIMMPGRFETLEPMFGRGVKVVEVDGSGERLPYARIRLDNHYIGQLAGTHLIERGYLRAVYLGDGSRWSSDRSEGLRHVFEKAGLEFSPFLSNDWSELTSRPWITKRLRRIDRPFAVMGCDDLVAAHAVRAINAAGWQIPSEVGVIGVDDRITECIGVQPPLSSISIERFRIGQEAARMLDDLLIAKGNTRTIHRFRPQRVTERESTSSYICADPDVAAAIALIHGEACNGLTIDDIVRVTNLSRRTLERRFDEILGRSPGEEIRKVRLDAVKRALERSHLPLADIAAMCGYSCISSLSHSFRQATGSSPQSFRKKARGNGIAP